MACFGSGTTQKLSRYGNGEGWIDWNPSAYWKINLDQLQDFTEHDISLPL